jgi:antitoxin FitA
VSPRSWKDCNGYNLFIRESWYFMTTFTITLPDERVKKLRELAERFRVAPEELVRVSLEELLTRPLDDFQAALERVLTKNADLYRRLA